MSYLSPDIFKKDFVVEKLLPGYVKTFINRLDKRGTQMKNILINTLLPVSLILTIWLAAVPTAYG